MIAVGDVSQLTELEYERRNLWPDELKILVVDDDQMMLNFIRLALEPAGFRIIRTTDAEEGLDMARREQPDLLILDIMMPKFDGFELLRRARKNPRLTDVPVILVSAQMKTRAHQRMTQWCRDEEDVSIDAYIGKPFNPAELLQTVKTVLVQHREYLLKRVTTRDEKPRLADLDNESPAVAA